MGKFDFLKGGKCLNIHHFYHVRFGHRQWNNATACNIFSLRYAITCNIFNIQFATVCNIPNLRHAFYVSSPSPLPVFPFLHQMSNLMDFNMAQNKHHTPRGNKNKDGCQL